MHAKPSVSHEAFELPVQVEDAEVVLRPTVMVLRDESGSRQGSVVFLEDVTDSAAEAVESVTGVAMSRFGLTYGPRLRRHWLLGE